MDYKEAKEIANRCPSSLFLAMDAAAELCGGDLEKMVDITLDLMKADLERDPDFAGGSSRYLISRGDLSLFLFMLQTGVVKFNPARVRYIRSQSRQ